MHVLLEGSTESVLFDEIFAPYWESNGWVVTSSVVVTARPKDGRPGRGGLSRWAKLERKIRKLLSGSHFQVLTTIIDYYGIPADTPGMSDRPSSGTAIERVRHVELAMARHCADPRFIPHLTLHESEAWVFAAADQLAELAGNGALATRLNKDTALAGGPEQVNDGPTTAPSKRIYQYWPSFSKTSDGPRAVADLGLIRLRERCPHLHEWLLKIESGK